MTVREYLESYNTTQTTIRVVGSYKHGLTDLYEGTVKRLLDIYKITDILEKKNWGGLDKNKCFLAMDIDSHVGDLIYIKMPDNYEHKDKNGKKLDCYL